MLLILEIAVDREEHGKSLGGGAAQEYAVLRAYPAELLHRLDLAARQAPAQPARQALIEEDPHRARPMNSGSGGAQQRLARQLERRHRLLAAD